MSEMTPRERMRAVMHFRKPDRLPFTEFLGFWDETTIRWHNEGLPRIYDLQELMDHRIGVAVHSLYMNYFKYFGLEVSGRSINIDLSPIPRFFRRTLEETDKYRIMIDEGGIKKKIVKSKTYSMPQFIDWPVKTREDFEKIKVRFKPTDSRRYPLYWSAEAVEAYKASRAPVFIFMQGFYANGRQLMGTVPFCSAFYKDPKLVREMMDFHADFLIETLREAVESLKSSIDYVFWHEDLAHRHGPNISPRLFQEFLLPNYKKVTSFFRRNGIDTIIIDTDGDPRLLIPLLLEGGINGLAPLEVGSAGLDAVALRKEYGKRLVLIGNIDKRALVKGKDAIEKEVESKLPYLKKEGGYIPSVDHLVSPDISYQNYVYYLNFLKKFL